MKTFNEAVTDIMKSLKAAEVKTAYYIQDPDKKYASAVNKTLYVRRDIADKAVTELIKATGNKELKVSVWLGKGHRFPSKPPYDLPQNYSLVK